MARIHSALFAALAVAGTICAQAPASRPAAATPKPEAAKPAATEPAPPRSLTGVWMIRNPEPMRSFQGATFTKEPPALTPWAEERFKQAKSSNSGEFTLDTTNDPVLTRCDPPGMPRLYLHPYPFEFIQTPKYTLMLFEYDHMVRRIYTDERKLEEDPELTWLGHSIGHWENNNTFVVESNGFNDKTWLDRVGHPHSTELKVTEKFRRIDMDHMELDFIIEDPKALVKPWTATFHLQRRNNWELGEISCSGDYLQFNKFEK
jgi:hypothetical protein